MSSVNSSERIIEDKPRLEGYPSLELHEEKIFIVVKTAPHPSISYREIVCTAGITANGKWIRLYPISYRYLNFFQRYQKYQWVKAQIRKTTKDKRIDSYRPNPNSIIPTGEPVSTKSNWQERKKIVLPTLSQSLEEIKKARDKYNVSLGIFKPEAVNNLVIEPDDRQWSQKHQAVLGQQVLFEKQTKELEKIPYRFRYKFQCADKDCKGHTLQITDWEIYELYRRLKNKYIYDIDKVLAGVKQKWLGEFWRGNLDSYLIVGTTPRYKTFIVLGVFRPKREQNLPLFQ
ncbi:MAG: hypothetical protein Q8P72_02200 [Candidatus Roizmanbacteria bacterium]|nr:hypothetical protein [Candidatus Roizmanbacteria bacterium]